MEKYDGKIFDGDSHIYERPDAWTRYMPEKFLQECRIQYKKTADNNWTLFIGNSPLSTSDGYIKVGPDDGQLIPKPGSLKEFMKALKTGDATYQYVPIAEDHLSADARIKKMDEFNVEAAFIFPGNQNSLPAYFNETEPLNAVLRAYNRYLDDEWKGFNYQGRINLTPMINFEDPAWALEEIDWALKRGARAFVMPVGPVNDRSPADPCFDPIWARLNEAHAVMVYHISEARHMHVTLRQWGDTPLASRHKQSPWMWYNCFGEVPLVQTLTSIIYYNLFQRFPNLRVLSAENGSEWVPMLRKRMDKIRGMAKNGYWPCGQLPERPSKIFDRHVYVVAYPEDDIKKLVDETGYSDNIIMGSDYPHAEGVPEPRDFVQACAGMSPEQIRGIMYDNGRRLMPKP